MSSCRIKTEMDFKSEIESEMELHLGDGWVRISEGFECVIGLYTHRAGEDLVFSFHAFDLYAPETEILTCPSLLVTPSLRTLVSLGFRGGELCELCVGTRETIAAVVYVTGALWMS